MTADMAGPGGRSGFGWSPQDGHWRSPLKGENRKVLSGGELMDWTADQPPYQPDAGTPVVGRAPSRFRWFRRWRPSLVVERALDERPGTSGGPVRPPA